MSPTVVTLAMIAGLFLGSAVWNVARNQAARRPLVGLPPCGAGDDSLPVSSWLPLFGFGTAITCPGDRTRQSPLRILFEFAIAGYIGLAAWRIDDWVSFLAVILFSVPLLVILLVDAWTRLIHTNIIGLGVLLGWVFAVLDGPRQLASSALAMVAAILVFGALYFLAIIIYRNPKVVPFGLGDVYLAGMIGAMVRFNDVWRALFYGIILAGVLLLLLLMAKRVSRKQAVPYGPFLALGALVVLVF